MDLPPFKKVVYSSLLYYQFLGVKPVAFPESPNPFSALSLSEMPLVYLRVQAFAKKEQQTQDLPYGKS